MDHVIEVDHLSFAYGHMPVLKDVSLRVKRGEFIGLIGPNGGGKTTLLKLILGFLKPSKGKIKVLGHPAGSKKSNEHLSYVPQTLRFDKQFPISVLEVVLSGLLCNLSWFGHYSKIDRQRAREALEKVGLPHLEQVPFGTLSGGQAQRILIARALVSNPEILLLDEPTASVDSQAEADIYSILDKQRGNTTILMVTHDLRVATEQVDRLFCVQGTVLSLKPEEVCEHFAMGLYHTPLLNLPKNHPKALSK